mmetsp:Transcript_44255/g.137823  ORF Transcript_44255/g.137823 Transcript_44255/m.137823 type:complete len:246 (-) Transcript_44255:12-749(-)
MVVSRSKYAAHAEAFCVASADSLLRLSLCLILAACVAFVAAETGPVAVDCFAVLHFTSSAWAEANEDMSAACVTPRLSKRVCVMVMRILLRASLSTPPKCVPLPELSVLLTSPSTTCAKLRNDDRICSLWADAWSLGVSPFFEALTTPWRALTRLSTEEPAAPSSSGSKLCCPPEACCACCNALTARLLDASTAEEHSSAAPPAAAAAQTAAGTQATAASESHDGDIVCVTGGATGGQSAGRRVS